jgi:hypothetical protein
MRKIQIKQRPGLTKQKGEPIRMSHNHILKTKAALRLQVVLHLKILNNRAIKDLVKVEREVNLTIDFKLQTLTMGLLLTNIKHHLLSHRK